MKFNIVAKEENPEVVVRGRSDKNGRVDFTTDTVKGRFFRVLPDEPRQVQAIQMMEMHLEKFAPAKGNGILITEAAADKFM